MNGIPVSRMHETRLEISLSPKGPPEFPHICRREMKERVNIETVVQGGTTDILQRHPMPFCVPLKRTPKKVGKNVVYLKHNLSRGINSSKKIDGNGLENMFDED